MDFEKIEEKQFSENLMEAKKQNSKEVVYKSDHIRDQMLLDEGKYATTKKFDRSYFGGDAEAQRLIDRFQERKLELSKEEMDKIRENVPDEPDFEVLTEEQYNRKWALGKYKYNKKVKNYFQKRKDTIKKAKKDVSSSKKDSREVSKHRELTYALANLDNRAVLQDKMEKYRKEGLFKEIEADPDAMDAAYEEEKNNEALMKAEMDVASHEAQIWKSKDSRGCQGIDKYSSDTGACRKMNKYLRSGKATHWSQMADDANNMLGKVKLSRDLVVRRGVDGVQTIAHMLNIPNADGMSTEEVKQALQDKIDKEEEVIVSDKGFMSTSIPFVAPRYGADSEGLGGNIGIEFIILAKKGTHAMNISPMSMWAKESELLIKPGTKLKLVDARMDGDAEIISGHSKSWKIYLTTVPESENGILKEGN